MHSSSIIPEDYLSSSATKTRISQCNKATLLPVYQYMPHLCKPRNDTPQHFKPQHCTPNSCKPYHCKPNHCKTHYYHHATLHTTPPQVSLQAKPRQATPLQATLPRSTPAQATPPKPGHPTRRRSHSPAQQPPFILFPRQEKRGARAVKLSNTLIPHLHMLRGAIAACGVFPSFPPFFPFFQLLSLCRGEKEGNIPCTSGRGHFFLFSCPGTVVLARDCFVVQKSLSLLPSFL